MSGASRYWTRVRVDGAGKRKIEEIASAKAFFVSSFPEFLAHSKVPDTVIQRQLWHWMREATEQSIYTMSCQRGETEKGLQNTDEQLKNENNRCFLAERCLLCFISSQVERVCQQLEAQFGADHGFTCSDLLSFVLDDDGDRQRREGRSTISTPYLSLLREILQSFDPQQSSLATWTTRRVKHDKELNAFLLESGVYLVSDWAILNDTSPKQLQRIFSQFYHLTSIEIQQASHLLESYHTVYRTQRLMARQAGIKGQCLPPTVEQLHQIAQRLPIESTSVLSPEALMTQLQDVASRLREYRIYVRGGSLVTESLDQPTSRDDLTYRLSSLNGANNEDTQDEQTEFLRVYRQQFLRCLDQAIAHVTDDQVTKLKRKDEQKAQKFLTALQLFHCQGRSMSEIAPVVNLQAQFHVSRLLKLKSFRADVRQQLFVLLRDRVFELAQTFRQNVLTNPERLETLNQQIEEALDEQITTVLQEAAAQTKTAKKPTKSSLFAQRLCRHLDARRNPR